MPDVPADDVVIELRQVTKTYPRRVVALAGVSLAVRRGERACLLGPNGAGKTTVVRLLQGALRPTAGDVYLLGVPSSDPRYTGMRRQMGVVPQLPGMYDDLLLREYLELVRRVYDCAGDDELMDRLGLAPFLDRPMAALSGGLQRRAVLAAALLPQPSILILDEPTAGLDPVAARDVRALLAAAMAGRTVLLCTHNLAEAEALCESTIILQAGRVVLHERIATLRSRLASRVRLAAAQGAGPLATALRDLGYQPAIVRDANGRAMVDVPLPDPERCVPGLLRDLLARGLDVYHAQIVTPTLEDLFFQAVEAGEA